MIRHRRTHYKTISLKLSKRQMKSLKNYCRARKTTPIKLIKKNIRTYIESYADNVPEKFYVSHNQLEMFAAEEKSKES
ncbi:MAG: hypothetical protein GXO88_08245 [Chlorobi bacterium]|nr:hypothetical protein [Chlorobiota bacterium]